MYIIMRKGKDAIVEEYHLCSICCKMFCCNKVAYVHLQQNIFTEEVFDQFAHTVCANNPPPPQPMIGETR